MSTLASCLAFLMLVACAIPKLSAETVADVLRVAKIPAHSLAPADLAATITNYAKAGTGPFLLAYHIADGSDRLSPSLRILRYDRTTKALRSATITAANTPAADNYCFGSALAIRESRGTIYIDVHLNPSAGCLLVLSPELKVKAVLPGWLLALIGADYAVVRGSETHFASVHPMHIVLFDVKRNQPAELYPYPDDPQRAAFSQLLKEHISQDWCRENNAPCDPENFETDLIGSVIVNEPGKIFGFQAQFSADGFGPAADKSIPARTVTYLFREKSGLWEHREFDEQQLKRLLQGMSLEQLITRMPEFAF